MNRYNIIFKKSMPILTVPVSYKTVKIIDHIRAENIEKAIELIDVENQQKSLLKNQEVLSFEQYQAAQTMLSDYEASLGDNLQSIRTYATLYKKYSNSTDEVIQAAVKAKVDLINTETEKLQLKQKNEVRLAKFEEDIAKKNKELTDSQINNLENLRKKVSELTTEIQKGNLNDLVTLANKQAQIDKINKEIETIENLIKAKGELKEVNEIEIVDEEIKIKEYDPSSSFDAAERARQDEINAEITKFEALKNINESGYSSIFDIFSKQATKKKAADDNLSAEEIEKLNDTNQPKVS